MISPISTLPSSGEDSCEPVISRVMDVMEGSASTILVQSFQQNLRPLMYQLQNDILAGRDALVHLGHCWMGLSRMLLDLFVPSTPIDPASLQTTASEFWEEEKAIILSQLRYHQNLEVRVSGTTENEAIHHLTAMAEEIQVKLLQSPPKPSFPCKRDANQLHTYWSEVDQFLQHVLSPPRIAALISSMESEGYHATPREEVIQESIAAFCQRLSTAYPGFDDITKPLHLALLFFRFGLRLVTHALVNSRRETHADEMALASSLASFPSIQAVDLLCRGELKIDQSPSHAILAKLAALTFKVDQGLDISTRIQEVTQLYEQAIGLWLIDQTRREQSDLEAQSLYKGRSNTSTDHPDLDPEEEEFLSVFPQFEDLLSESSEGSLRQHTVLVTESLSSQISTLHGALFSVSGESTTHRPSESFTSIRYRLLAPLVETGFASWSETLDENSIPTQLDMLIHQIASLEGAHHATDQTYDFYHDVNIPEIKKGAAIVSQLCNRLRLLAIEWPEQMVLQHLITRCEGILKLRLGTPVAMVLCSLEQLLLQSEDWQTFANRENSIKDHQQSLVALIIEWRQLELSTWQGLLAREASTFANDISTWWFRLYEVTVRGVLDAAKGSDERRESLSHFLDELVPLLDSFLSRSPLGQFQSRLQLLRSFEMYLGLVTVAPSTIGTETFKRVHLILSSSRKYFAQFEAKTSTLLSQQLLNIERDIRDVIKLASWRDVNVHALRQSAQRSHRQLFKYIRKFREVLRQPVGPLLQLNLKMEDPRDPDEALVSIGFPLPSTPTFPERFHGSLPRHLVHLDQTYHNFCDVIKGKIVPTLDFSTSLSVESLSTEIITSSKHLSSIVVPTAGDTTKRVKLQKHLLTRKRKAWSDLLKELKRSGLSSNVKPEVLAQQQNIRWLREQPVLNFPPDDLSLEKAEGYFVRLLGGLPLLRASLPDHNPDLPTRDLQRGTMFLESAFALALRDRSS